jgi:hypothetical protein
MFPQGNGNVEWKWEFGVKENFAVGHSTYVKLAVGHWNTFSLLWDTNFFVIGHRPVYLEQRKKVQCPTAISQKNSVVYQNQRGNVNVPRSGMWTFPERGTWPCSMFLAAKGWLPMKLGMSTRYVALYWINVIFWIFLASCSLWTVSLGTGYSKWELCLYNCDTNSVIMCACYRSWDKHSENTMF